MKPGSKAWKAMMGKVYGIGGGVVIIGALFKIMHWPGASLMLIVGLGVEACIFFISAFEPIHEDPNWELVYPELALAHDEDFDIHQLSSRYFFGLGDQSYLVLGGAYTFDNRDYIIDDDYWSVNGSYYFNDRTSVSVTYSDDDYYGVSANYFINQNYSVQAGYNSVSNDSDENESEGYYLSFSAQF